MKVDILTRFYKKKTTEEKFQHMGRSSLFSNKKLTLKNGRADLEGRLTRLYHCDGV